MPTFVFTSIPAALRQIAADTKNMESRLRACPKKAARKTRNLVASERIPVAFGELRESLHVVDVGPGNSEVVADAPHAAAIEVGSKPHMPPLEPLVRWVLLRGLQGISPHGSVKAPSRDWKKGAARPIAEAIQGTLRSRAERASWHARAGATLAFSSNAVDDADPATLSIARAIQFKIAKVGTKPHRYMGGAVPDAIAFLEGFVKAVLDAGPTRASDPNANIGP